MVRGLPVEVLGRELQRRDGLVADHGVDRAVALAIAHLEVGRARGVEAAAKGEHVALRRRGDQLEPATPCADPVAGHRVDALTDAAADVGRVRAEVGLALQRDHRHDRQERVDADGAGAVARAIGELLARDVARDAELQEAHVAEPLLALEQPLEHRPAGGVRRRHREARPIERAGGRERRGRAHVAVEALDRHAELRPAVADVAGEQQLRVVLGRRDQGREQVIGLASEELDLVEHRDLRVRLAQPDRVRATTAGEVDLELALALESAGVAEVPVVDREAHAR